VLTQTANWELETMKAEMHKHLDLTMQEAVTRLQGNWSADVAAYDQIHEHILHMSDLWFDELDRYVDLEAAGRDADAAIPGLRAHLEGCPACREEHESLYALVTGEQAL
jgi:hypothetical protein